MAIQTALDSISQNQGSPFGFKNRIINGGMVIDQRNAGGSVTPTSSFQYNVDRWYTYVSQSSKMTVQRNAGSVTPPPGYTNYLGVTSSSSYSPLSTDQFLLGQSIEGYNVADLDWGTTTAKDVTLSFWVRSSLTGQFSATIESQDGNNAYVATYTINSSNTWEYKTLTIPGRKTGTWEKTNSNGMYVLWNLGNGTNFQTGSPNSWVSNVNGATGDVKLIGTNAATFYITGVQLEVGKQATSFDYRPYGTELSLCQRYYEKTYGQSVLPGTASSVGMRFLSTAFGGGNYYAAGNFVVPKRSGPTMSYYDAAGNANKASYTAGGWYNNTLSVTGVASNESGYEAYTSGQSGYASQFCHYIANAEL